LRDELELPPTSQLVAAMLGSPARTIRDAARGEGSDLIVLGTNQRNGFERALICSVTADVIRDTSCDILVIPVDSAS
jgi:nucleotide-binding universal stress UspA family protein